MPYYVSTALVGGIPCKLLFAGPPPRAATLLQDSKCECPNRIRHRRLWRSRAAPVGERWDYSPLPKSAVITRGLRRPCVTATTYNGFSWSASEIIYSRGRMRGRFGWVRLVRRVAALFSRKGARISSREMGFTLPVFKPSRRLSSVPVSEAEYTSICSTTGKQRHSGNALERAILDSFRQNRDSPELTRRRTKRTGNRGAIGAGITTQETAGGPECPFAAVDAGTQSGTAPARRRVELTPPSLMELLLEENIETHDAVLVARRDRGIAGVDRPFHPHDLRVALGQIGRVRERNVARDALLQG